MRPGLGLELDGAHKTQRRPARTIPDFQGRAANELHRRRWRRCRCSSTRADEGESGQGENATAHMRTQIDFY